MSVFALGSGAHAQTPVSVTIRSGDAPVEPGEVPFFDPGTYNANEGSVPSITGDRVIRLPGVTGMNDIVVDIAIGDILFEDPTRSIGLPATATVAGHPVDLLLLAQWVEDTSAVPELSFGVHFSDLDLTAFDASWALPPGAPAPEFPDTWVALATGDQTFPATWDAFYPDGFEITGPGVTYQGTAVLESLLGAPAAEALGFAPTDLADLTGSLGTTWEILNGDLTDTALALQAVVPPPTTAIGGVFEAASPWTFTLDFDLGTGGLELGMGGLLTPVGELAGGFPDVAVTGGFTYDDGDVTATLAGALVDTDCGLPDTPDDASSCWVDALGNTWLDLTDVGFTIDFGLDNGVASASVAFTASFDPDGSDPVAPFDMTAVISVEEGPPDVVTASFTVAGSLSMADIVVLYGAQGTAASFPGQDTLELTEVAFTASTAIGEEATFTVTAAARVLDAVYVEVLVGLTQEIGGETLLLLGIKTSDLSVAALFEKSSPRIAGSVFGELAMPGVEYTVAFPLADISPPYTISVSDLSDAAIAFYNQGAADLHLEGNLSVEGTVDLADLGDDFLDAFGIDPGDALADYHGSASATFDWGGGNGAQFELTGLDLTAELPDAELSLPDWLGAKTTSVDDLALHFAYDGTDYLAEMSATLTTDIDDAGAAEVIEVTAAFEYLPGPPAAFSFEVRGVMDDWVEPFGMDLTVVDATMAFTFESDPFRSTATISGGVPLGTATLIATAELTIDDDNVSADFRLDLVGAVPLSDIAALAERQLGGAISLGSSELEDITVGPGSIVIHVGENPSFLAEGTVSYLGVDAGLLFSVDATLDFAAGIDLRSELTFGDLDDSVPSPFADFNLPDLTVVVTNAAVDVPSDDLDPAVFDFFKEVHGCDASDAQGDCSFDLVLAEGVTALASAQLPASFAAVKDALWIEDNPVLLKGFVPLFGSSVEPRLEGVLPPITPPPGSAPEWFESGQLSFFITPRAFGLEGAMTVNMDGELLTFALAGELNAGPPPSLILSGALETVRPWVSPFGVDWLTINSLRIELGLGVGVTVGFRGDVVIGDKDLDISVLVDLTGGVPKLLGLRGASVAGFSLTDLATFQGQVAAAGGGFPINIPALTAGLPNMALKSVEFSYGTESRPDLCLEPGIVIGGDLFINPTGGATGEEPPPGTGCQQIPARPDASQFCIDNRVHGCFVSMRLSILTDGITAVASLPGFTIGNPTVLRIGDAGVDLVINSSGQSLQVFGSAEIPGFTSGALTMSITPDGRAFQGDFRIFGVFFAYVDATMSTPLGAVFNFDDASFHVQAVMRADFTSAVRTAVEPFVAEIRRLFNILDPLLTSIEGLNSTNALGVVAAVPGQLSAAGIPSPAFLTDIAGAVGEIQGVIDTATRLFEDAGLPIPAGLPVTPLDFADVALNGFQFPAAFPGLEIPFVPEICAVVWVGGTCYAVPPTAAVYVTVCAPWPFDDECARVLVVPATPGIPGVVTPSFCPGVEVGGKCYALGLVPVTFPGIPGLCDTIPGAVVGVGRTWVGSGTPECGVTSLVQGAVDPLISGALAGAIGIPSVPSPRVALDNLAAVLNGSGTLFAVDCAAFSADIGPLQASKVVQLDVAATILDESFGLSTSWDFARPADSAFTLFKNLLTGVIFGNPQTRACAGSAPGQIIPPPSNLVLSGTPVIDENGTAIIKGTFTSDPAAAHTVSINWRDGSTQTVALPDGTLGFTVTHHYPDDSPTSTPADQYLVGVQVVNPATGSVSGTWPLTVRNVPPSVEENGVVTVSATPTWIEENGVVTVSGTFVDPGSLDRHRVVVDWKDGAPTIIDLPAGARDFTAAHRYLDDNPTGSAADGYLIDVTVVDDDTGLATATLPVTVANDVPADLNVTYSATSLVAGEFVEVPGTVIDEGMWMTVAGTFDDVGSRDAHQVVITWGEGEPTIIDLGVGERQFLARHRYFDDNPTGTASDTYPVHVTVVDDDLGLVSTSQDVTVNNVTPFDVVLSFGLLAVDENEIVTVKGSFTDPGLDDVHSVEVDWGDDTPSSSLVVPVGDREFVFEHRYFDDDPTATPLDEYTLTVTFSDDDLGEVDPADMTTEFKQLKFDENGFPIPKDPDVPPDEIEFDTITITRSGDEGGPIARVRNVPSEVDFIVTGDLPVEPGDSVMARIVENGTVILDGWFVDPGTLDSHTVCIDWGDERTPGGPAIPAPDSFAACIDDIAAHHVDRIDIAADPLRPFDAPRLFGLTHQYLDDNPTATDSDVYDITVWVIDDDTGEGTATRSVRVDDVAPVITATPTTQDPQYSDPLNEKIVYVVTDVAADGLFATTDWRYEGGPFTPGLPAALQFAFDGCEPGEYFGGVAPRQTCRWSVDGIVDVQPGIYTIRINVLDDDGLDTYHSVEVDVQPEDARAFYTGPTTAAGVADGAGVTSIPLRATIKDITVSDPADPAWDEYPGDISNAVAYFVDRATGAVLCSSTVGHVFATAEGRGTAACTWGVELGGAESLSVDVGVLIGWAGPQETVCPDLDPAGRCSWYTRDDVSEDTTVTVVQPSGDHLTAGAWMIAPGDSAGVHAIVEGTTIQYNVIADFKARSDVWTELDGLAVIYFDSGGRRYRIEAARLDTLGLVSTGHQTGTADLEATVSLADVTTEGSAVVLGTDLALQMRMTDNGNSGASDMLGFAVWSSDGALLVSSSWSDVDTVERTIHRGNLTVHMQ